MKAIITGAGTYGSVYHHYLQEQGDFEIIGFVDDDPAKIGTVINGLTVLSGTRDFNKIKDAQAEAVFVSIGNNEIRRRLFHDYIAAGFLAPGFAHKSVIIPDNIKIGKGVYILPGTIIMPFAEIHDFVMISMGVKVAHHTILREASFLSTGVNMGAGIDFGVCAFAGMGSTIMTGIKRVGNYATIGAGAVIIRNVADYAVVAGNPGRVIKKVIPE